MFLKQIYDSSLKYFCTYCFFEDITTINFDVFLLEMSRYFIMKSFPSSASNNFGFFLDQVVQFITYIFSIIIFSWDCPTPFRKSFHHNQKTKTYINFSLFL